MPALPDLMRLSPLIPVAFVICAEGLGAAPQEPIPPGVLEKARRADGKAAAAAPQPASPSQAMRPRQVFGEVVDENGDPVAGVGVTLGSLDSLVAAECLEAPLARTDAAGRFEFTLQPPPVVPTPPAAPAAPAESGPLLLELDAEAAEKLAQEIAKTVAGEYVDADLAAAKAIEDAKKAAAAARQEIARRKYLLVCGDGWVALRVTMPAVDHAAVRKLREPKTEEEKAARIGLDVMARVWGRAATPEKDGVDLKKLVVRRGVTLTGRVTDDAGQAVEGVRISARDLMTSGRFRGFTSSNSKRYYCSYATTGTGGRFRLPGVFPTGSQLTVKAKGFFEFQRPVVGTEELEIRLRRSALFKGRLVRQDGEVATGTVHVRYEVSSASHTVKVEKDGSFEFHPKHPDRFRLVVTPNGESAKEHTTTYSPILEKPGQELVVVLAKKKIESKEKKPTKRKRLDRWGRAAKRGFAVSVVDALTGRPLREFQAAAIWVRADYNANESYYMGRFSSKVKKSKQPGYVRLPGPPTTSTPKGAVIVKAKGYAPFVRMGLEFEPEKPPRIIAEMVPESILGGVVHDEVTGEEISGVNVRLYRLVKTGQSGRSVNAKTDASGRFMFKGLREGRYRCSVSYKGRPSKSITVELGAEEKRADLKFVVGRAARLTGRVVGAKPGKAWEVELLNENYAMSLLYNPGYRPSGKRGKLKEDGSFEITGVTPGFYEVCLRIPRDKRKGDVLQIPVEPVRIRKGRNAHVVVDASADLPGRLTGKIRLTGAKLDFARLMVVATTWVPSSPYNYYGYSNIDVTGARSRVAADGTFTVEVASGKKKIRILDVITGVQLYATETPIEVESGETATQDVQLALTEVNVKLEPAKEGGRVAAAWLNIDVEQPMPEALRMFVFFSSYNGKRATGISLVGRSGDIQLVLPPYKTRLQVYSDVARLSRAKSKPRSTLGEIEITPKLGQVNEVEIEVEVPTTGFEPEPADKKVDDDMGDGEGPRKKVGAAAKAAVGLEAKK